MLARSLLSGTSPPHPRAGSLPTHSRHRRWLGNLWSRGSLPTGFRGDSSSSEGEVVDDHDCSRRLSIRSSQQVVSLASIHSSLLSAPLLTRSLSSLLQGRRRGDAQPSPRGCRQSTSPASPSPLYRWTRTRGRRSDWNRRNGRSSSFGGSGEARYSALHQLHGQRSHPPSERSLPPLLDLRTLKLSPFKALECRSN